MTILHLMDGFFCFLPLLNEFIKRKKKSSAPDSAAENTVEKAVSMFFLMHNHFVGISSSSNFISFIKQL